MVAKKSTSKDKKTNTKTKKTNVKKTKPSTKKIEDKYVIAELAFYCCDNNIYFSLKQLFEGLGQMSDDTFNFHVNNSKNDFYNWIRYVYGEEKLAEKILKSKSKKEMIDILKKSI